VISRFLFEEDGQTLVEYGLLMALIAIVVVAAISLFGKRVNNSFNYVVVNSLAS